MLIAQAVFLLEGGQTDYAGGYAGVSRAEAVIVVVSAHT